MVTIIPSTGSGQRFETATSLYPALTLELRESCFCSNICLRSGGHEGVMTEEKTVKTALALTREEWRAYRPGVSIDEEQVVERWERAWEVARAAADLLRYEFGATRVVVFGSLARRAWFTPWSDVDLAAWGLPPDAFYRAVASVTGISPDFKVDLVAPEDCRPALRQAIEQEGVNL
jgi:predicted nucleotidyltransferase